MADQPPSQMSIGEVLKSTRSRQGLEIRTVEERTKIRTKYLRALENEDWDTLPSSAYAKGFLRTYAQLLGLDADALVDEYRRRVEVAHVEPTYPVREAVLEHRRRPGEPPRRPSPALVLGAVIALIVGLLLVIGLVAGDDDDGDRDRARVAKREARAERQAERRAERRRERRREARREAAKEAKQMVKLRLVMESDVSVCLLGEGKRPLIDSQVLLAGNEESFEAKRFELRFPFGYDRDQFKLTLNGKSRRLPERQGAQAFVIRAPDRVRPAPTPGTGCP
jgi:cytoskeleton protein RodZ